MSMNIHRIEVTPKHGEGMVDVRAEVIRRQLFDNHNILIKNISSVVGFIVKADIDETTISKDVKTLFADPIIEVGNCNQNILENKDIFKQRPDAVICIGFKPGVTDNPGTAALDGLRTLHPNISVESSISTTITYAFNGLSENVDLGYIAKQLYNPLIQKAIVKDVRNSSAPIPQLDFPEQPNYEYQQPAVIDLEVPDSELIRISEEGILALSLLEMQTIQAFYRNPEVQGERKLLNLPEKAPTDVELECLAQTWSEHCKHKIFAAKIEHHDKETGEKSTIDSLFKTYIMKPTVDMQEEVNWLLSIFHDNSGVISWSDDLNLCIKVETHNSPSALDPYGGAMTGIVGVNRDILGTGLGARPIANTDVFCFGPPNWEGELPENLFHPSRVLSGVHAGIRVGGNESGIPTVNGAIVFDDRFIGKPLVYAGTVGIMPRVLPDGRESHIKTPAEGDLVYMIGGRVGYDGIHGATFSSLELTEESPSSAVQIGDPITQKKMLDMVLEARDSGYITCITDNGAGGLSSSIGEMAEYTNGCEIDLGAVPLKQSGLSSWEILISESQERMTVAVHPDDQHAFETLADLHEVEHSIVARFTTTGLFHVKHGESTVALLPLNFLHDGVPQLELESEWEKPKLEQFTPPSAADHSELLLQLLARPNVASKETLVRQYDHEVICQTVVKPFVGKECDGPGDSGVLAPLYGDPHGFVVSCGLAPRYSDIDAGAMAAAAVDEAVRNAICSGVDPAKMAGCDNFCWPDPILSEKTPDGKFKLAQLVRANRELERACRGYMVPCISGKDSMKNDYGKGPGKISIPPTMLFTLLGDHPDVRKSTTSDLLESGHHLYLLGETREELGANEIAFMLQENGLTKGVGGEVPRLHDIETNLKMYTALSAAIHSDLVASAHDCSDGGLAVSLAEMCIGGRLGASINLSNISKTTLFARLYGESLARIVVAIKPENTEEFEHSMSGNIFTKIGESTTKNHLEIKDGSKKVLKLNLDEMVEAWQSTFKGGDF